IPIASTCIASCVARFLGKAAWASLTLHPRDLPANNSIDVMHCASSPKILSSKNLPLSIHSFLGSTSGCSDCGPPSSTVDEVCSALVVVFSVSTWSPVPLPVEPGLGALVGGGSKNSGSEQLCQAERVAMIII